MKTISMDDFRADPTKAHELAHSDEGVAVVDDAGVVRFTLWIPDKELSPDGEECRRQLHEALGFHPGDLHDFTWQDLLNAVRRDVSMISAVRRAVED